MDTEKCAALLTAIRVGNLTDAAQELGYTPSGMSRMMASLEQETGFPLLHRSRSGVRPTAECERMLPVIRELVRLGDLYTEHAQSIRGLDVGEVHIGTAYASYYQMIGDIVAGFSKKYPHIKIEMEENFSSRLVTELEEHRMDFCIISKREGNFDWIALPPDHLVAWVPMDYPMEKGDKFPLERFAEEPCIEMFHSRDTDNARAFHHFGVTPNYTLTAMNSYSAAVMVEAGLGVTMSNALFSDTSGSCRLKILEIEPSPQVEIGIAMAPKALLSPAAQKFRDYSVKYLKAHPEWMAVE